MSLGFPVQSSEVGKCSAFNQGSKPRAFGTYRICDHRWPDPLLIAYTKYGSMYEG